MDDGWIRDPALLTTIVQLRGFVLGDECEEEGIRGATLGEVHRGFVNEQNIEGVAKAFTNPQLANNYWRLAGLRLVTPKQEK